MLVRNWMSKNVITIEQNDSMQHAMALMKENKIRMLPVMDKGQLVGIISDSDLKRASASDATLLDVHELLYLISKIKISNIMTKNPLTINDDLTVEETAQILMEHNISGVPVLGSTGKLVGIITRHDLFKSLISLSGLGKKGIQLAFLADDQSGSIKELTDVIRRYGARIASILSTYDHAPAGKRLVYLRIYDIDRAVIPELSQELKTKGSLIYMVDHRDNKRHIYQEIKA